MCPGCWRHSCHSGGGYSGVQCLNPIKFAIVSLLTLGHDAGTGPGVSWSHPPPPTPRARDGADEWVTTAFISMLSLIAFCLGLNLDRQCLYYDCGWWLVAVIIPAPGLYQWQVFSRVRVKLSQGDRSPGRHTARHGPLNTRDNTMKILINRN